MNLTIIAAVSENNVIGLNGTIPWEISEDMKRFRDLTLGHPVIMGRRTYESIPEKFRPLSGRKNIVLSNTLGSSEGSINGIFVARDMQQALQLVGDQNSYVAGGSKVYENFLPLSTHMEITSIPKRYEGDTFFPKVNWDEWKEIAREEHKDGGVPYSFLTYERREPVA